MNTTNNNGVLEWAVTAVEGAQPRALSRPGPMSRAKIIEGDALEVLAAMPEHSVDMQIHDPPYSSGGFTRGDRMADPCAKYLESTSANRLLKTFTGDNRDAHALEYWQVLWMSQALRVGRASSVSVIGERCRSRRTRCKRQDGCSEGWRSGKNRRALIDRRLAAMQLRPSLSCGGPRALREAMVRACPGCSGTRRRGGVRIQPRSRSSCWSTCFGCVRLGASCSMHSAVRGRRARRRCDSASSSSGSS